MLCDMNSCTGCGCCSMVCPSKCISMQLNLQGYSIPVIDSSKCTSCKICEKHCPVLGSISEQKHVLPEFYMAYDKDPAIVNTSASGGLFYSIARETFQNNGTVFGAAFDNTFTVRITMAESLEALLPIQGSKYVQSLTDNSFLLAREKLDQNIPVYYAALPCQIAGLKSFLKKDYENLITSDIVCHGVCSSLIFEKYLQTVQNNFEEPITYFSQTDKSLGWNILIQKATKTWDKDSYLRMFLDGLFFKPGCYQCQFANIHRQGDITLGDFFGYGTYKKAEIKSKNGISMVMVNTEKGKNYFEKIKSEIIYEKRTPEEVLYFNHSIWKPSRKHKQTDAFLHDYQNMSWDELEKKYYFSMSMQFNLGIRMLIKKIIGKKNTARLMLLFNKLEGSIKEADKIIAEIK